MNGAATSDLFSSNDEVFSPCRSLSATEQSAGSAAISPIYKNKGRFRSVLQPPSRQDADVARRESQLWIDQGYNGQKVEDFSLSSEEGIYSLSALDSDEEDAYSYILDLHKEVILPHNQLKSQVPTRAVFDMEPDDESGRKEPPDEKPVRGHSYGEEEKTERVSVVIRGYDETEPRVDEAEKTQMFKTAGWQKEVVEDGKKVLSVKCLQANEKTVADDIEMNVTVEEGKDRKLDEEEEEEEEDNIKDEDRENQQRVNLDSFGVGVNKTVDKYVYEDRGTSATRINTGESQDNGRGMDGFTSNSKEENKGEYTTEIKNSVDFDVGLTLENSELKTKKCRFTDKKAATVNHPIEPTPKNDTGGGVNIHEGDGDWTSGYSATSHSFR